MKLKYGEKLANDELVKSNSSSQTDMNLVV